VDRYGIVMQALVAHKMVEYRCRENEEGRGRAGKEVGKAWREERGGRTGKEKGEKERWREFREEGGRAEKKGEWQGRRRKSIKGRAVQGRRAVIEWEETAYSQSQVQHWLLW